MPKRVDLRRRGNVTRDIATDIERRVKAGDISPDEPLPSVRALAKEYGVAPLTVQRAVDLLRDAGLLRSVPRVGTFVNEGCPLDGVVLVTSMEVLGMAHDAWCAFGEVLTSAQGACAELGIPLMTATERDAPERFTSKHYGYLFVPSAEAIELSVWRAPVIDAGAPHVSCGYDHGLAQHMGRDDKAASRLAIEHLAGLGHRDIALFPRMRGSGRVDLMPVTLERSPGLRVRTYPVAPVARSVTDAYHEGMRVAFEHMLETRERPTAIACGVDSIVLALMDLLDAEGLRVPEDCSVLGYCREAFGTWRGVAITRMDNPRGRIAAQAVKELVKMATGGPGPGRVWLTPELIEGETCAPVAETAAAEA